MIDTQYEPQTHSTILPINQLTKMNALIKRAAEDIAAAKLVTALTGAGISTESGIPPFRGKGGLWVGTSAEVQPAAMMPVIAKDTGATIIEINPQSTALTGTVSDYLIKGKAGEVMNHIIEELEKIVLNTYLFSVGSASAWRGEDRLCRGVVTLLA
jgi:hypothetical protein